MDRILNKIDSTLCTTNIYYCIDYEVIDLSVLLKNITNPINLYNIICKHSDITPELIISLLKKIKEDSYITLLPCRLITQEFCDKYKDSGVIRPSIMIRNKIPIEYIVKTYANYIFNYNELRWLSEYCKYDEYIKYCKPSNIPPCIGNPNMTLEWFINNSITSEIEWDNSVLFRADLFTVDVIMKYKAHIYGRCPLWGKYFNMFPVTFIEENINIDYCDVYNCIDIFKKHPGHITWYTIDKYISARFYKPGETNKLNISKSVLDLPRWFLKKYKDSFYYINNENINNDVNYKFIVNNGIILCDRNNISKCRNKYIALLKDITDICNCNGIAEDLHECILSYT